VTRYRALAVQTRPRFGAVAENVESALRLAARACRRSPADLVVLPELFSTGYAFVSRREALALAEDPRRGRTARRLVEFARDLGVHLVAGLAERAGRRAYNSAVAVGPRGVLGVYRKVHLFDREKLWFAPGIAPWPVFRMGRARVGLFICFDWRFPEAARALALAGAEVLAHPSNLVMRLAPAAMRTRALENAVFAVTANRVGEDRRPGVVLRFTGTSQIVDPRGRVLARASGSRPGVVAADLDLGLARDKRVTPRNHLLLDRVPRLYRSLSRGGVSRTRPGGR
jgi:predicted amidohydrolase